MFALVRLALDESQRILCLFNMTPDRQDLPMEDCLEALHWNDASHSRLRDLTTSLLIEREVDRLELEPYQYLWLTAE